LVCPCPSPRPAMLLALSSPRLVRRAGLQARRQLSYSTTGTTKGMVTRLAPQQMVSLLVTGVMGSPPDFPPPLALAAVGVATSAAAGPDPTAALESLATPACISGLLPCLASLPHTERDQLQLNIEDVFFTFLSAGENNDNNIRLVTFSFRNLDKLKLKVKQAQEGKERLGLKLKALREESKRCNDPDIFKAGMQRAKSEHEQEWGGAEIGPISRQVLGGSIVVGNYVFRRAGPGQDWRLGEMAQQDTLPWGPFGSKQWQVRLLVSIVVQCKFSEILRVDYFAFLMGIVAVVVMILAFPNIII